MIHNQEDTMKGDPMLLEMKVFGLAIDPFTNAPIIILKDVGEKNVLPIWIGPLEASAIATELEKVRMVRPMTHDLVRDIFKNLDVSVAKIEITKLEDNIYYALIHLSSGSNQYAIDSRPSDAIAIALRTNSPIFVDKQVIEKSKNLDIFKDSTKDGKKRTEWLDLLENLAPDQFGKYKM